MHWHDFQSRIRRFSPTDQATIERAFQVGEQAHQGQTRKSGDPYFTHPVAVAQRLADMGADKETIVAALLHDTVEDTGLTLDEIDRLFGRTVAALIDGVTKMEHADMSEHPTMNEKIETLRKMFTLMQKDVRIMVIKLVDRLHNMETIGFQPQKKQIEVAKETLEIYVKIADRLCMRDIRNELETLCHQTLEPQLYTALASLRMKNQEVIARKIVFMKDRLEKAFPAIDADMMYEQKSWEKLRLQYDLAQESLGSFAQMNIAIRCKTVEECYTMLGHLHQLWPREALTFDDFINTPVINGYRGLHTTVILEDGTRIRCKIRTEEMERYAHEGIAMLCFQQSAANVSLALPWTQRISPLSKDTHNRSEEFWQTLQSDILSESILIYGPANKTALVPRGASALDGALYLFPETALYLSSIRVNGRDVPLSQELSYASSVDIIVENEPQVKREWLYWVQTGVGIAMVRTALATTGQSSLVEIGRGILEHLLRERGHGYMEELSEQTIRKGFADVGYANAEDGFTALANRHLEPSQVVTAMMHYMRRRRSTDAEQECTFTFAMERNVENVTRLIGIYNKYNEHMEKTETKMHSPQELRFRLKVAMSPGKQEALYQDLIAIGAHTIVVNVSMKKELALMGIVVFFWSLNAVWAKHFIESGITPLALLSLRSILFFVFTTFFFLGWYYVRRSTLSPVRHAFRLSILPAAGTFLLSLLTYMSIDHLPPSVHLTILRFNVLLLPALHFIRERQWRNVVLAVSAGLFMFTLGSFAFLTPDISDLGLVLAVCTLLTYTFYSLSTERILQQNKIGTRYPFFLFHIGILVGIGGLLALPAVLPEINQWRDQTYLIALYVFFCVFIPHTCFHIVLQRARFRHVTSMSLVEMPLAVFLEVAILGLILSPVSYLLIAFVLLAFIVLLRLKVIR